MLPGPLSDSGAIQVVPVLGRSGASALVDFVVPGTPKSQQADNKSIKRWQQKVKAAAPDLPEFLTGPLRVRIAFFFNGTTDVDTDNIIKPIQDALEETIYENDKIVVDVCARKIDRQRLPAVVGAPTVLLAALAEPAGNFVFVRVASAQNGLGPSWL